MTKTAEEQIGATLLEQALRSGVDWSFNCSRGTCARCRCFVEEGGGLLNEPTDAEWDRLDPEELEQGFRLGCQARVEKPGNVVAANRTYF